VHPLRVETLGGLRILQDGREVPDLPAQPVRCALFVYLAVERGATRDVLASLLWPDRDQERARHSLSQTLYELRRDLGDDWVESRGDRIDVTDQITSDAVELVRHVEEGRHARAFELWDGPFLSGVHLASTVPFQRWSDGWSGRLARHFRSAARELVAEREGAGNPEDALAVARRWVAADPLEDEAQHALIRLLAATGRRSEALRHFDEYEALLARELEVAPLEETRALVAELRAAAPSGPSPREGLPSAAPPPHREPAAGTPTRRRTLPRMLIALASVAVLALVGLVLRGTDPAGTPTAPAEAVLPSDAPAPERRGGIVVLPFVNMSPNAEQPWFADGITEDLIAHLSRIEGLRVISRTSAMRYQGTDLPLIAIVEELGVQWVLEGSVRRDGSRVRIVAQLIDGDSDDHLWASTFDRELTDIFVIQSEIAEQVADALRRHLPVDDRARIARGGTDRIGAYELVLRGREYLNRPGEADIRKYPPAMAFFHEALELDPGYARALAGLSQAYRENVGFPLDMRRDSAIAYGRRAVEADPELPEAAGFLGFALVFGVQRSEAREWLEQALKLDPNQVEALAGMARLAWIEGRLDEAIRWQRRAVSVDPFSARQLAWLGSYLFDVGDLEGAGEVLRRSVQLAPDAPAASFSLAQIHLLRGEEDEAEATMRRLAEAAGGHAGAHFLLGRFEAQRGRLDSAADHLAQAADVLGGLGSIRVHQAWVALRQGDEAAATRFLADAEADLLRWEAEGFEGPRLRFNLQLLRNDRGGALETFEGYWPYQFSGDLLSGPQAGVYWIDTDPFVEDLRDDARFQALVAAMRTQLDSMRALASRDPSAS
jgi:TolB-like protein/DNA-binding SARP family transcriptional activator/cytochrome c-type biogenesis protein CcmH/NrfG